MALPSDARAAQVVAPDPGVRAAVLVAGRARARRLHAEKRRPRRANLPALTVCMPAPSVETVPVYRFNALSLAVGAISLLLTFAAFHEGIERMVVTWFDAEEYSHGILIPLISAFLI